MERNLHETTSQWKTYGKRLFSEDLEVRDDRIASNCDKTTWTFWMRHVVMEIPAYAVICCCMIPIYRMRRIRQSHPSPLAPVSIELSCALTTESSPRTKTLALQCRATWSTQARVALRRWLFIRTNNCQSPNTGQAVLSPIRLKLPTLPMVMRGQSCCRWELAMGSNQHSATVVAQMHAMERVAGIACWREEREILPTILDPVLVIFNSLRSFSTTLF
jgi:hypothetical protein